MVPFRAKYPGKALWTTYFIVTAPIRLIFMLIYYLPRPLRQNSQWSWHQAIANSAFRMWFSFASTIEIVPPKSLEAGPDKDSWASLNPAPKEFYREILDDADIKPAVIGGMWYNTPYIAGSPEGQGKRVVLHFHGGAFVLGGVRPKEGGNWGPSNLAKRLNAFVFCPQYRLSSYPNGRFPAALQDAVTSYKFLLDLGIPASSIILSGDSAGGNIALALLKYVTSQKDILPSPAAILLWSPWVDLTSDWDDFSTDKRGKADYVPPILGHWALRVFKPASLPADHPYISPLHSPFPVDVPIWITCGSIESLRPEIKAFEEKMKAIPGNIVELLEVENAPHDIFIVGNVLGWGKESEKMVDAANVFLDTHRILS